MRKYFGHVLAAIGILTTAVALQPAQPAAAGDGLNFTIAFQGNVNGEIEPCG